MNLFSQLNNLLTQEIIAIATITGGKGGGVWVGKTLGDGVVLLHSHQSYQTGQKVYYNALDNRIIGMAPDVDFRSFGV